MRAEGADLRLCDDYDDAERCAKAHGGAVFISPYAHPDVIAGAGTVGLEIVEDWPEVDAIVVAIGGGGLISGIAIAAPSAAIVGVEAEASSPFTAGLAAGRIVEIDVQPTLADGLAGNLDPDTPTFGIVQAMVERVVLVSEDALRAAIRGVVRHERLVVEGAGSAGVAALLSGEIGDLGRSRGSRVVRGEHRSARPRGDPLRLIDLGEQALTRRPIGQRKTSWNHHQARPAAATAAAPSHQAPRPRSSSSGINVLCARSPARASSSATIARRSEAMAAAVAGRASRFLDIARAIRASSSGGTSGLVIDGAGTLERVTFRTVSDGLRRLERMPASDHLVQHHAEREQVAARIDPAADRLFRREIPGDHRLLCRERVGRHRRERAGGAAGRPRHHPEVQDLGAALWRDHHRVGAQITVDDAARVAFGQRVGNLRRELHRAPDAEPDARHLLPQRRPGGELVDEVTAAVRRRSRRRVRRCSDD